MFLTPSVARLVPTPEEIKYKEDRVRGLNLMLSINTTLSDQHSIVTETENHETSHEKHVEHVPKQPITEHEPPRSHEEHVEQSIIEQLIIEPDTRRLNLTNGHKGKKRRVESSEKHSKSSRRHKHSKRSSINLYAIV